jgi:hypothetical protein
MIRAAITNGPTIALNAFVVGSSYLFVFILYPVKMFTQEIDEETCTTQTATSCENENDTSPFDNAFEAFAYFFEYFTYRAHV